MLGKAILWLSAIMFTGYGLVSLASPMTPAGFAGLEIVSGDGFAEIGAMYGGLQTGIGLFCAVAASRAEYFRAGLLLLFMGVGTLALARGVSALVTDDPLTFYTWGALAYELLTAIVAAVAWRAAGTEQAE